MQSADPRIIKELESVRNKKTFRYDATSQRTNADGKVFDEIVEIIADEWNLKHSLAHAIVKSWWDGKVMRNFNWEEEATLPNGY